MNIENLFNKIDTYVGNEYNSIKVAFDRQHQIIYDTQKALIARADDIAKIINVGDYLVKTHNANCVEFVNRFAGNRISHNLGFNFGYGQNSSVSSLVKRGGGYCGEWTIVVEPTGEIKIFTDKFPGQTELERLISKADYIKTLTNELDELIIATEEFISKL